MSMPSNMEEFAKAVEKDLTDRLENHFPGIQVEHTFIEKAQGESYNGMRLHLPEREVAPILKMEPYYERIAESESYNDVLEDIAVHATEAIRQAPTIDMSQFTDYEHMREKLLMQAIPIRGNEDLLKRAPHREMEDIALIYRVVISDSDRGKMSTVITNDMMQRYEITADELYADAVIAMTNNDPYKIAPLFDALCAMSPEYGEHQEPDNRIYLATNGRAHFGAGVIGHPEFMGDAARIVGDNFFILPSSIHEVLLVPDDGTMRYQELEQMVAGINASMVSPEERLTDNVYHYDAKDQVFEMAKSFAERMAEKQERPSVLADLAEKKQQLSDRPVPVVSDGSRDNMSL